MKWYVVKNEWGKWGSDWPPFDSFAEACKVAEASGHKNVMTESLFLQVEGLPQTPSNFCNPAGEKPETD